MMGFDPTTFCMASLSALCVIFNLKPERFDFEGDII